LAGKAAKRQKRGREWDVIDVASKHLNTMGVSIEWFREIAAELEISRPAIYNYATDRDDLLFKCYLKACEAFDESFGNASAGGGDAVEVIDGFLTDISTRDGPETAVLSEVEGLPLDKQAIIWSRRNALVARLSSIIQQGVADRLFRPLDTVIVANAVVGMASWAPLHRRWTAGGELAQGAVGMKEILFRGLAADPKAAHAKPVCYVRPPPAKVDLFDRRALEDARREGILMAASALFNSRGIGGTRVEDVGSAVGLSKRAIYHYIGQKDVLVDACFERAFKFYLGVMDAAERLPGSRLEAVFGALHDVIEATLDPELSVLVPYVGSGQLSPSARLAVNAYSRRLTEGYRRLLIEGERDGSIRSLPIDEVVPSLPGVFSWASNSPSISRDDRGRIADELATLTTRGILA